MASIGDVAKLAGVSRSTVSLVEGIETEAELECLCRLGVHYGQGYFLGRPDRTFKNVRNEAMLVLRRLNNKS